MWHISQASIKPQSMIQIIPTQILYCFDGPQIFSAMFGFVETILVKVDDLDSQRLWLAAQIDKSTLSHLQANEISFRCAFLHDHLWIIKTNRQLFVEEYWNCGIDDIDESLLPAEGVALDGTRNVPDNVEQATAFFAIRFAGEKLTRAGVLFSEYKSLIDKAYEATRRILSPVALHGARSNVIDFRMRPATGSLIISIDKPIVNFKAAKRRMSDHDIDSDIIVGQFEEQRNAFLGHIKELLSFPGVNTKIEEDWSDQFSLLDIIHEIIPTSDNDLRSVTFTASSDIKRESITIDEKTGDALYKTYKSFEGDPLIITGDIDIINSKTNSFVISSELSGRQITCYLKGPEFKELQSNMSFRNGARLSVRGKFWRRPNRDAMSLIELPSVLSPG